MMKKLLVTAMSVIILAFAGCRTAEALPEEEIVEMNEIEKELLSMNYPDADRIRAGRLYNYQMEALNQLRFAMHYMEAKYPSCHPEYVSFDPATRLHETGILTMKDGSYVQITESQEGYLCGDTYYGILLQESYSREINLALKEGSFDILSHTDFSVPLSDEVDGNLTAEDFMAIEPPVMRSTHLYMMDAENIQETADAIQKILKEKGFYGSYILYDVPADKAVSEISILEEERLSFEAVTFSCFDTQ